MDDKTFHDSLVKLKAEFDLAVARHVRDGTIKEHLDSHWIELPCETFKNEPCEPYKPEIKA